MKMTDSKEAMRAIKTLTEYMEANLAKIKSKAGGHFSKALGKRAAFIVGERNSILENPIAIDFNQATDICRTNLFKFAQIELMDGNENTLPSLDVADVTSATGLNYDQLCPTTVVILMDNELGYQHEMGYLVQRNPIVDRLVIVGLTRDALAVLIARKRLSIEPILGLQLLSLVNSDRQYLLSDSVVDTMIGEVAPEQPQKEKDPLLDGLEM